MKRIIIWISLGAIGASTTWGGDPIRFIRPAKPVSAGSQAPVRKVDREFAKMLDAIETPSPFDGVSPAPGVERPRSQGRGGDSRRAQLARQERENWLWFDEGELQAKEEQERALGVSRYEVEGEAGLPGDERTSRIGLRAGAVERRSEEREGCVPTHLLSPRERQKQQIEAAVQRRVRSETDELFRESLADDPDSALRIPDKVDLGKLLTTGEANPGTPVLRELLGGGVGGPVLGRGPEVRGLGGALTEPGSARFGSELGPSRYESSFLDRGTETERGVGADPGRWSPTFTSPNRADPFPGLGNDLRARTPTMPEGPTYTSPREIPDFSIPRRR